MKKLLIYVSIALVLVSASFAATGDLVGQVNFATKCPGGIGVGIAFDGQNLWYSCINSVPDLYRANPSTGAVTASYNIAGGLGALSYDAGRNAIWAGYDDATGAIRLIQLDNDKNVTGTSTAFNASIGGIDLLDGIAYDAQDDSVYLSSDVSPTIYQVTSSGSSIRNFPKAPGSTCGNSGVAIGGQLLYEGFNGCNQVIVVNKTNTTNVVSTFSTVQGNDPGFRDEDLECDVATFANQGKQVMWSVEAYDTNRLSSDGNRRALAFEIPYGTCGSGGQAAPVCGNNQIELGEQCDDGNTDNGDGCSSICQEEEGGQIPEFTGIGVGLAAAGAGVLFFIARRKRN